MNRFILVIIFTPLMMHAHYRCRFINDTDTPYTIVHSNKGHIRTKTLQPDEAFTIRHHDDASYQITGHSVADVVAYLDLHADDIAHLIAQQQPS